MIKWNSLYPTLPSDDSDMEPIRSDDADNGANGGCNRDVETEALQKELQVVKKKEVDKGWVQTWKNNATPETHGPIARVKALLEQPKLMDETQE